MSGLLPLILTLLAVLLGGLAVAFVLAPLRRPDHTYAPGVAGQAGTPTEPRIADLLDRRAAALEGLAELDFDRTLGNLSEADYESLRRHYRAQAIGVLKEVDRQREQTTTPGAAAPVSVVPAEQPAAQAAAAPISRRGRVLIGGVSILALLAVALFSMALRDGAPRAAADVTALNVLQPHAVLPVPGTEVELVAHAGGLLSSRDGGRSWQGVAGVSGTVFALTGDARQEGAIYLAAPDGILRSADAGASWEAVPRPPSGAAVSALAVADDALYALVPTVGLFRRAGTGAWAFAGAGLPADTTSLLWVPAPLAALYASSPTTGVLASGDGGNTWGSASGVLNGTLPTRAARTLAFDPDSGDQFISPEGVTLNGALYVGTDSGLFKSINGGTSWTPLPLREPLAAVGVRSAPTPLILAVDSRGRVWRSRDRGATWRAAP